MTHGYLNRTLAILLATSIASTATAQELLIIAPDGTERSQFSEASSTALTSTPLTSDPMAQSSLTSTAEPQMTLTAATKPSIALTADPKSTNTRVATATPEPALVATTKPSGITTTAPSDTPPPPLPKGTTVRFTDVLFEVDSAQLKEAANPLIAQFAEELLKYPTITVRLEGHTDSTGSESHNLKLSKRRAQSVFEKLVHHGVHPDRLSIVGYGENRPIASNANQQGRSQNRRVDAIITIG